MISSAYLCSLFTSVPHSYHLGAFAVFMAWINMTFLLGRFPQIGIYIYMSVHVIKVLLLFLCVYATCLLAFAFAFNLIQVRNET